MTTLRIVADDVVELDGVPVARLLPGLRLSLRDDLAWAFDSVDEAEEDRGCGSRRRIVVCAELALSEFL